MGNRYIQPRVIKELYAKSGNTCAFPGCTCPLFFEEANISEICHIEGLNQDSARFNPELTDEEANSIENLILLCPNHHSLVDQNEDKYTVEYLKQIKSNHEAWAAQQLNARQKNFFIELQRIFQECRFDMIFLQQSFDAPFQDWFFDKVEEGYCRIRDLLNDECSLDIPAETKKALYSFTQLAEYTMTGVAIGSHSNGAGFAIPKYNPQDSEAICKNVKMLQETYMKYRFS